MSWRVLQELWKGKGGKDLEKPGTGGFCQVVRLRARSGSFRNWRLFFGC